MIEFFNLTEAVSYAMEHNGWIAVSKGIVQWHPQETNPTYILERMNGESIVATKEHYFPLFQCSIEQHVNNQLKKIRATPSNDGMMLDIVRLFVKYPWIVKNNTDLKSMADDIGIILLMGYAG